MIPISVPFSSWNMNANNQNIRLDTFLFILALRMSRNFDTFFFSLKWEGRLTNAPWCPGEKLNLMIFAIK